jgi:hypothetical protein
LANDGLADSLPALVTINILPPVSPVISSFLQNSNGVFQLAFAGDSNTTYCVWASTNLANWEYLGLAAQATPGTFQFQDLSVGTSPQRFYRISTGCGTPVPRLSGNSAKIPGGAFALSFTGGPYWSYRVWASTNLVNCSGQRPRPRPASFASVIRPPQTGRSGFIRRARLEDHAGLPVRCSMAKPRIARSSGPKERLKCAPIPVVCG